MTEYLPLFMLAAMFAVSAFSVWSSVVNHGSTSPYSRLVLRIVKRSPGKRAASAGA